MIFITPDKSTELRYHEKQAQKIRESTKAVHLRQGPFDGCKVRIQRYYSHFASTVPKEIAANYPPFEFDGIPTFEKELVFVAWYEPDLTDQYVFERIKMYKRVGEGSFPVGFEEYKVASHEE